MPPPKRGLGRGLEALLPQSTQTTPQSSVINPPTTGLVDIDPKAVAPNPEQPRHEFDEEEIERLSQSIDMYGLLHPIVVELTNGVYYLVAGERRLRASQKLGLATIPAIIRPTTDRQEALELALSEIFFAQICPRLEEAAAYNRLADTFGLSHEMIATRLGKSRVAVTNTIRLLALPAPIQKAIADSQITAGHGRAILALHDEQLQITVAGLIIKEDWSVRKTEQYIQFLLRGETGTAATAEQPSTTTPLSPEDMAYCTALESLLGTPVSIKRDKRGGRLLIHFQTNDDLSALYERLGGSPL